MTWVFLLQLASFDWHVAVAFSPRSLKAGYAWPTNTRKMVGFLALLLLWSLALQIPSFAITRVRVDDIEKEKLGEVKG
jgi:hypothetical protein